MTSTTRIDPQSYLASGSVEEMIGDHEPTEAQIAAINDAIEAWAQRDPDGYSEHESRRLRREVDDILSTQVAIDYTPADVDVTDDRESVAGARVTINGQTYDVVPPEGDGLDGWLDADLAESDLTDDPDVVEALEHAAHEGAAGRSGRIVVG